jgi:serine/threonine-protein kinase
MIGRKLKNYRIEELLGEGGMGVVYLAKDENLNRRVALKMLHPEMLHQPDLLKRFKNEAHVTARLTHPNIATLYNFFSDDDLHCLVMEYVKGKTLEEILHIHKRLPVQECIRILLQLLEGLEEAHQNEILHRDIKPGNVMINQSGYVKLMDFGVARFESSARMTRMNRVIGTLEYMAPELLTGGKPNIQADLYSVGVVAYEIYTGHLPFEADNDGALTELILKGGPSFSRFAGEKEFVRDGKLESIIKKLMHKKTSSRYKHSKDVLEDLRACRISGRVSAQVLGADPIREAAAELSPPAYADILDRSKRSVQAVAASFKSLYEQRGIPLKNSSSSISGFFKTTEGKILGGAIGFALFLFLFSGLFQSSGEIDEASRSSDDEPTEEVAINYSGIGDQSVPAEESGETGAGAEQGSEWLAPPEIVIPGRTSGGRPGEAVRDSRETVVSSLQDQNTSEDENTDENSAGQTENLERDTTEPGGQNSDRSGSDSREMNRDESPEARTISVAVTNQVVEGIFDETVSTLTHKEGDSFYLRVTGDVYADGYKVINAGARIRGVVQQVRDRGRSRRATLAVTFEEVMAVDGSWLKISYPEYSNQATGSVSFEKGRSISRLRIESGMVTLEL